MHALRTTSAEAHAEISASVTAAAMIFLTTFTLIFPGNMTSSMWVTVIYSSRKAAALPARASAGRSFRAMEGIVVMSVDESCRG